MRYETKEDLPESLRHWLPEEALELYVEAYQKAWDRYEERRGGELDQASVAHRDAMHAVRQEWTEDEETHEWYRQGEEHGHQEEEEGILDKVTGLFESEEES